VHEVRKLAGRDANRVDRIAVDGNLQRQQRCGRIQQRRVAGNGNLRGKRRHGSHHRNRAADEVE